MEISSCFYCSELLVWRESRGMGKRGTEEMWRKLRSMSINYLERDVEFWIEIFEFGACGLGTDFKIGFHFCNSFDSFNYFSVSFLWMPFFNREIQLKRSPIDSAAISHQSKLHNFAKEFHKKIMASNWICSTFSLFYLAKTLCPSGPSTILFVHIIFDNKIQIHFEFHRFSAI